MIRLRYAMLAMAAGIVLVCGCLSLSQHPLFPRLHGSSAGDCCDAEAVPDCAVPAEDGLGPVILPPPNMVPPTGLPAMPPSDRLQPVPNTSPRTPASPSSRVRDPGQLQLLDK